MTTPTPTIGVFDSGFGGLTVLRALLPLIPGARYIYLGDTARLPYGSKSRETIVRYALSSARFLADHGADLLVIACNTATALALEDLQQALAIPVVGVIQPGAQAAKAQNTDASESSGQSPQFLYENQPAILSETGNFAAEIQEPAVAPARLKPRSKPHVLVLATSATTQSRAYTQALRGLGLEATEKACPLLVPLVEEGWIDHPVTSEVLRIYLSEALAEAPTASTLLLGCTHYPLIAPLIQRTLATLNHPLQIIDSAEATARAVAAHLNLTTPVAKLSPHTPPLATFYATDSVEKFQHLGSNFLGQPLSQVHLIDLGG